MKNKVKLISTLAVSVFAVAALGSCGKTKEAGGENTIQVRMYQGGYGRDWFDALARKFEEMKAKQGVTVKVDLQNSDYSKLIGSDFVEKMEVPKDNQYDLFLLDGPDINKVVADSYAVLSTSERTLLEPLTPLLNKPAINFEGKEESSKIGDRLYKGYKEMLTYHRDTTPDKWDGQIFQLPWCDAFTGISCNTSYLTEYGMEVPVTSNQFVNTVKTLKDKLPNGVKVMTYAGKDAPGYWDYLYQTWFAQYLGYENYQKFIKCWDGSDDLEASVAIRDNGFKVYNVDAIKAAISPLIEILHNDYLITGCHGQTYGEAQNNFANKRCVFMMNGDWLVKEMKESLGEGTQVENLKNSEMLRTPVLSSIGTEIGLSNDDQLAQLVKLIDAHKTNEEIKAAMPSAGLDDAKIARVKYARTVHHGEGANHVLCVPSYCDAKDVTLEFIRFMYSEDACNLYGEMNFSSLPLSYTLKDESKLTTYEKSLKKLYDYDEITCVDYEAQLNEIRDGGGILAFNHREWVSPVSYQAIIKNNSDSTKTKWTAEYIAQEEFEQDERQWSSWMGNFSW